MSFDPRSLERLRELGRQLPQKLPDPAESSTNTPHTSAKAGPKRHRVETEQDPDALFRELMTVSEDGTVPEHLMARLKQLEARRQPPASNPLESPIRSSELPPPPSGSSGKGKTTRPRRPSVTPGSEEESLYVAFGQLLLEDDEDAG
jgi:hypothetical protein